MRCSLRLMVSRLSFRSEEYACFDLKTNVRVRWRSHPRSCLYHATHDGKLALCGVKNLVEENPYPSCVEPFDDLMTCLHCQGMVRRIRHTSQS